MKSAHDGMEGHIRELGPCIFENVDDAGMRAHGEDDKALTGDMNTQPTFVDNPGVGFPSLSVHGLLKMERQTLLERRNPRNFAADIKHLVQEHLRLGRLDHVGPMVGQRDDAWDILHRQHVAVGQLASPGPKHAWMSIKGNASFSVALAYQV